MTTVTGNQQDDRPLSFFGKSIVVLLTAIPIVSVVAYGAVDSFALGVLFVLAALIVLLWIVDALRSGEVRMSTDSIQLPLIGLITLGLVQLLPLASTDPSIPPLGVSFTRSLSEDPYATRFFLIHLFAYLIFLAAALVYAPGIQRLRRISIVLIVFGTASAFFGILQRLSIPEAIYGLRETPQAIPFGPYVNQHHFASLMLMTSGLALGVLFGSGARREQKIFAALGAGIMGMAVIFTGSRGGLIAYLSVVALAAAASFIRRESGRNDEDQEGLSTRSRNLLVAGVATGLVVLVFGSVLFLGGQDSFLRGVGLQNSANDITSGRSHFWRIALQIFLENPILGAGLNAFGVAFSRFDTWNGAFRVEQAHNDYLQMLADGGIVGFGCVVIFVVIFLKRGYSAITHRREALTRSLITGAFAGCCGVLVHSALDFPLRTPANALVFLLIVVLVVGNTISDSEQGRRP